MNHLYDSELVTVDGLIHISNKGAQTWNWGYRNRDVIVIIRYGVYSLRGGRRIGRCDVGIVDHWGDNLEDLGLFPDITPVY